MEMMSCDHSVNCWCMLDVYHCGVYLGMREHVCLCESDIFLVYAKEVSVRADMSASVFLRCERERACRACVGEVDPYSYLIHIQTSPSYASNMHIPHTSQLHIHSHIHALLAII